MLKELPSPFSVTQTIEKITANAKTENEEVADVKPLHNSVKKHGGELPPVMLINLCQENHVFNILKDEKNKDM